ncbi:MAG: thioredoxin domain-containing protein, partial [Planctomycetaceae bacterium]|nr:thioredoxin domain-containing protein [Planctomycetaceae bacterium]
MHPISNCARSSATRRTWQRRVTECLFCLGCLAAGATLVALAAPAARPLSAGASVGQTVPQVGLLDFTATWCGPCQQMSPIVEGLQRQGYPVYKVDVDQRPDLAKRFHITGMPTFVLVVNGQEVMRQTGATSEPQLRRMLLQIPEYQQIAQQNQPKSRPAKSPQIAAADLEFGPSATGVELSDPQPVVPQAVAAVDSPGKPMFAHPFRSRNNASEERPARNLDNATVRGQEPETDPMLASTRLRVKDKTGVNYGSGTIIHSRVGRTLILTCGHIFRGMDQSGTIEVDVFGRNRQPQTYVGKVLHYDLEADVRLRLAV